jgi:NADPH-dependent curcumin reductase CurA
MCRGFLLADYLDEWQAGSRVLANRVASGQIDPLEVVVDGLDAAPQALVDLLAGANLGKTMVRVSPDPQPCTEYTA